MSFFLKLATLENTNHCYPQGLAFFVVECVERRITQLKENKQITSNRNDTPVTNTSETTL